MSTSQQYPPKKVKDPLSPWRRDESRRQTPAEKYSLVSRGEGSLTLRPAQKDLFHHLQQQLEKNNLSIFPVPFVQARNTACHDQDSLDAIVVGYRKLREGLFASRVVDSFVVVAYEHAVVACLYSRNFNELMKSLSVLTHHVYPSALRRKIPCSRRGEFIAYHLLLQTIKNISASSQFFDTFREMVSGCKELESDRHIQFVWQLSRAIRRTDYIRVRQLSKESSNFHQYILRFSVNDIREEMFAIIRAAYYQIPVAYLTFVLGTDCSAELVELVKRHECELDEKNVDGGGVICFKKSS